MRVGWGIPLKVVEFDFSTADGGGQGSVDDGGQGSVRAVGVACVGGVEGAQREVAQKVGKSFYHWAAIENGRRDAAGPYSGRIAVMIECRSGWPLSRNARLNLRGDHARARGELAQLRSDGSTVDESAEMQQWIADRMVPPTREWNLAGFWAPLPGQTTVGHESSKVSMIVL